MLALHVATPLTRIARHASPDRPREDDNIVYEDPKTLGEDSSIPMTQHASIVGSAGVTIMEGTEQHMATCGLA